MNIIECTDFDKINQEWKLATTCEHCGSKLELQLADIFWYVPPAFSLRNYVYTCPCCGRQDEFYSGAFSSNRAVMVTYNRLYEETNEIKEEVKTKEVEYEPELTLWNRIANWFVG